MAVAAPSQPFISARPRARRAVIFLIATTVFSILLFGVDVAGDRLQSLDPDLRDGLTGLIALFFILALLLSAVTFLGWLHRAFKNLRALGARTLRFTPGWAVGWFFVPIVNLFRPYEALTELWHASDPAIPSYEPASRPAPAPVRWWWMLFVLWGVTSRLAEQLSRPASGGAFEQQAAHLLNVVSYVAEIPAAILAIRLIHTVDQNQEQKHKASSSGTPA